MIVRVMGALLLFLATGAVVRAQTPASDEGQRIYREAAPSVFLIEVRDTAGSVLGTGSAFLIEGNRLVTNAHVVRSGQPYLRTGAVALPLEIERISAGDDLAILSSGTPLDAAPLSLADSLPPEGAPVWVLGNPKGLERTLSSGIVSAVRREDDTTFLQHTAAISPGSSGGPVLNGNGRVVAVTIGFIENGQNLNFAVPAARVRAVLQGGTSDGQFEAAAEEALRLSAMPAAGEWSADADSPYQTHRRNVEAAFERAAGLAPSGDALLMLASRAYERPVSEWTIAADLAMRAIERGAADADSARVLVIQARRLFVILGEDTAGARTLLGMAEQVLRSRPNSAEVLMVRAETLRMLGGARADVYASARRAIELTAPDQLESMRSRHQQIAEELGDYTTADSIFAVRSQAGALSALDWAIRGGDLSERGDDRRAAQAYVQAYLLSDRETPDYACSAGRAFWQVNENDSALEMLRSCIDGYALATYVDTTDLVYAHRGIAAILVDRGVYASAETHARQALRLDATSAWAAHALASALLEQDRYSAAAAAAEEAIRLSDGKYAAMHFVAGLAYSELREWNKCERAFRLASELDPKEPNSPYNVALCLERQGFARDAVRWYEEVLRRMPGHPKRVMIQDRIRQLRGR